MKLTARILLLSGWAFVSAGFAAQPGAAPVFEVRLATRAEPETAAPAGTEKMTLITHSDAATGRKLVQKYFVERKVLLDQSDIESVDVVTGQASGRPELDITFTPQGKERFAQVTGANIGKQLAIVIDGKLYEAPVVKDEISGGKAIVSGSFTRAEAETLSKKINEAVKK